MASGEGLLNRIASMITGTHERPMVLVLDDDVDSVVTVSHMLRSAGYTPGMATDTDKALSLLRDLPYAAIVSDLWMPGTDGIEFVRQARQIRPGIPVILMTARGDWDTYMEAMHDGVTEYLQKPIDKNELVRLVQAALAQRR